MKRTWLLAAGAAAAIAALGVGAVWAQTSGTPTPASPFLDRVAQKLGIDSPKLQQAITDTRNEDIDAAVARGDLTQQQADALKQRSANGGGPGFFGDHGSGRPRFDGPGDFGPGGPAFRFGFEFGLPQQEQKFADFLGIPADQLRTELKAEKTTLASVAAAHGKSRDDLKSFITDDARAKLDEAVQSQDLTQPRVDDILSKLSGNLDKLIDGSLGGRMHEQFEFHGHRNRGGQPAPGAPPVPQSGSTQNGTQF